MNVFLYEENDMNVLVTGGTGFVGSHLIPALLKEKYEVICLVRNQDKAKKLERKYGIKTILGDVTKAETLTGISDNIDYVIHLAAMGHVSAVSEEAYHMFVGINETGTKNLVKEFISSKRLKKFIHFSSTAAMGPAQYDILDETSEPNPKTPYQKSKYRSEQIIVNAYKEQMFPGIVIRPCMIYGPGGYGEFYKFCKLMKKGIFPKVGRGKNLTPLVYVKDVVSASVLALKNGNIGETYIIASDISIPMDELRYYIIKNIGSKSPYIFVPCFIALTGASIIEKVSALVGKEPIVTYTNIKSTIVDRTFKIDKAKKELKYVPECSFEDGIKKTIQWYQAEHKI